MADDDILAGLDFEVQPEILDGAVDLTMLSDLGFSTYLNETRQELIRLGEMNDYPGRTERGKELHSRFAAMQIEKQRRGWQ